MNLLDGMVALTFIALLIGLATLKRTDVRGDGLSLFRALLPSWRFFEQVQPAPQLLCRFGSCDAELGPWHGLLPTEAGMPARVLLNARGNLRLACVSVMEQLEEQLATRDQVSDPTALTAYQLVRLIAVDQLRALPAARGARCFQFCIAHPSADAVGEIEHSLVSAIHECDVAEGASARSRAG